MIMKKVTKEIREMVQGATEIVLEEKQEVDFYLIKEVLEKDFKVRFFNDSVLQVLVKEALDNIVYICL